MVSFDAVRRIEGYLVLIAFLVPPLLMGFPGLCFRWQNRLNFTRFLLLDLFPSWLENCVLLATGYRLYLIASSEQSKPRKRFHAIMALCLMTVLTGLFGLADYCFQKKSGMTPNRLIIRASMEWSVDDELSTNLRGFLCDAGKVFFAYTQGVVLTVRSVKYLSTTHKKVLKNHYIYLSMVACLLCVYCMGGWTPVLNCTLCWTGIALAIFSEATLYSDPSITLEKSMDSANYQRAGMDPTRPSPNIVLIITDSLSGAVQNTDEARNNMPFYRSEMAEMKSVFQFEHARAVSGSTTTAVPAVLTGLNPFTRQGMKHEINADFAGQLKYVKGYETAMFSAWKAVVKGTPFTSLRSFLTKNFDHLYDPVTTNSSYAQDLCMDDRRNIQFFQDWIKSRDGSKPFYAAMHWGNAHAPWKLQHTPEDGGTRKAGPRYIDSMGLIDEQYQEVFNILRSAKLLRNTIIVGTADHGDYPGVRRIPEPDDLRVLHVPLWMHVPKSALPIESERRMLYKQEKRIVSVLDIIPTLRHIVGLGRYREEEERDCFTGMNLIESVNGTRSQMGWSGAPQETYNIKSGALSISRWNESLVIYVDEMTKSCLVEYPVGSESFEVGWLKKYATSSKRALEELSVDERQSWAKTIQQTLNNNSTTPHRFYKTLSELQEWLETS